MGLALSQSNEATAQNRPAFPLWPYARERYINAPTPRPRVAIRRAGSNIERWQPGILGRSDLMQLHHERTERSAHTYALLTRRSLSPRPSCSLPCALRSGEAERAASNMPA